MLDTLPTELQAFGLPQVTHTLSPHGDIWGLESVTESPGATQQLLTQPVLAQQFDQDILGDLGGVVRNFIDSGQVWALLIGIVLGYLVRGLTTYK